MQIRAAALMVGLGSASVLAQAAPPDSTGRVGGVVYDSVANAPAARALVQLVPRESASVATYSTTADERGRFEISGIPPGSYLIGFYHVGIDSLNIQLPPLIAEVRAGEMTRVDLAVPTPQRIIAAICAASASDSVGAIVGYLRDARGNALSDLGSVSATWNEITIGGGGLKFVPMQAAALVGESGSFVLCGVPAASDVALIGAVGGDTSGAVVVRIPDHGLMRRDVAVGGTLNVRGIVLTDAGLPAMNAEVMLAGRDRPVTTDSAGAFRIFSARAGTQTLEVRALGYLPERRPVTLAAGRDTSLEVRLTSLKALMDTIQVVAERVYWADRGGFRQRQRRGFGYFFDDKAIQRRNAYDIFSLLQTIPSVHISRSGFQRSVTVGSRMNGCVPSLHIDGTRFPKDMVGDLDFIVPVDRIAGLEVYTRSGGMPAQFSDFNSCGAIVVWTQAPAVRSRR